MSGGWLELIRPYLEANLLLGVGAALVWAGRELEAWSGTRMGARAWLRVSQLLFVFALVLPVCMAVMPRDALWAPSAQVWSGAAPASRGGGLETVITPVATGLAGAGESVRVGARGLVLLGALLGLGIAFSLARLGWQVLKLRRLLAGMPSIRRIGRVSVVAGVDQPVPFSARLGSAWVVVPESLLSDASDYRIAVQHELQHHRQGDTWWVFVIEGVRALCFWNPAVYAWARLTTSFQEFACDDALIGRRCVSPQAYGRCLLRTAQSALGHRRMLAGTAGMAADGSSWSLKRRIEMMTNRADRPARRWLFLTWALCAVGVLTTSAYASRSALQNGTLTLEEARNLAEGKGPDVKGAAGKGPDVKGAAGKAAAGTGSSSTELPLVVNQQVLDKLNEFLGRPEGRNFMKKGLERMPEYRAAIEKKLAARHMPLELVALPLIESGYNNMTAKSNGESHAPGMRGAGIWMFIPATARRYGMAVDEAKGIDERLDVEKETEAALNYLTAVHDQFKDWPLAIAAYNMGEKAVQGVIDSSGSRDAWKLVQEGKLNDYLPTVMAGMIVVKNPSVVE